MNKKVLIVEDQFVEANDLQLMLRKAGYDVCGIARSVEIAQEIVKKEKPGLVLLDIFLKGKRTGIDLAKHLKEDNIAFIYLSANSNEEILSAAKRTEPYGFIVKPFREKDLLVTLEIARYRHEHGHESKYRREADVLQQLENIATTDFDLKEKLAQTGKIIQQEVPFDYLAFEFEGDGKMKGEPMGFLRIAFDEYQVIGLLELSMISGVSAVELIDNRRASEKSNVSVIYNADEFQMLAGISRSRDLIRKTFQMKSLFCYRMEDGHETFSLSFYSRRVDAYESEHVAVMNRLRQTLVGIIWRKDDSGNRRRKDNNENGKQPQSCYDGPRSSATGFVGIVGNSHLLLNVFDLIAQVAPFDTSVLVLGESGTGKEKIAESIHNLSPRKGKPFVKVNCAALPASLIESELFGHEKGSFTGATEKRTGKFEQANGGTIFLDEIGEMPVDLQVKLLRVLQEKEIEPIGCRSHIKINVRVIAATNRNLEKEVGEGRFRLDLYYRLNVFPIVLPPLRDRVEDIPALAHHFITTYNRKAGKKISGLSEKALENLMSYNWPGNIRELENLIERSVLLAKGLIIEDVLPPTVLPSNIFHNAPAGHMKTIHENERDYIISVLKKCHGKIWGVGGAAEILSVPPSTLKSKMKKLGIPKDIGE